MIAVYFRDLHDGPWFGINEDKEFDPASMMKVPVMIAWLKRAETNPIVLNETVDLQRILTTCVHCRSSNRARSVEPGRSYVVEELLQHDDELLGQQCDSPAV